MNDTRAAQSADVLERVFASVKVMLAYLDRDFNFVRVNRAYAEADGRTPGFFTGKNHFVLYPNAENEAIFQRVVDTGEPYRATERPFVYAEHPERGVTYWDWLLQPVTGMGGQVEGLVLSLTNVTETVRARKAAQQAATYARELIEASVDPLVTVDTDGRITDVNAATEQATGRTRSALIGTDFSRYFTDPARARAGYRHVFATGEVRDYALEIRRADGAIIPVLYNATVYHDETGGVAGVFAAARDVSRLRQVEDALRRASLYNRSLIEASLDPLVTIGPDGRIMDVNAATEQVTGRAREALVGTDFSDYFTEPDEARAGYKRVFREGLVRDYPLVLRHADGHTTPVLYNASLYRDEKGNVAGVFAAARDVTERRRAEQALQELNRELERRVAERTASLEAANRDLESFSYSVSHDLRTPLRAVDGFSRILLEDYRDRLDDEGRRLLNIVRENTERMGQLISDILTFSRTGRAECRVEPVDMEALARDAWLEVRQAEPERQIEFRLGLLPAARGDRNLLRQILVNLFGNAVKFTRPRKVAVIEAGARTEGAENVYWVKDNGVGFDMRYADHLFGVFQRLHSGADFEGTGIGLAIVKRIATRHGGRVWAEGRTGEGATFYFSLPKAEAA